MADQAKLDGGMYSMRPCENLAAVTPHDTNDLTATSRWIYVGIAGDLEVITLGGDTVVISSVAAGSQLPIQVTRIKAANTDADDIIVGW